MTHHEFVIIHTAIPKQLLTSIEVEALQSFGLILLDDGQHYAISSGESVETHAVLKIDNFSAMLERIANEYIGEQKPIWLKRIENTLLAMVDDPFAHSATFILPSYDASILSILQECLSKRGNSVCHQVKEIHVEGSYFTARSQTVSTGGWAAVITEQGIQLANTRTMTE